MEPQQLFIMVKHWYSPVTPLRILQILESGRMKIVYVNNIRDVF